MKKRWIASVIEASKAEKTRLPFERGQRSWMQAGKVGDKPIRKTA